MTNGKRYTTRDATTAETRTNCKKQKGSPTTGTTNYGIRHRVRNMIHVKHLPSIGLCFLPSGRELVGGTILWGRPRAISSAHALQHATLGITGSVLACEMRGSIDIHRRKWLTRTNAASDPPSSTGARRERRQRRQRRQRCREGEGESAHTAEHRRKQLACL